MLGYRSRANYRWRKEYGALEIDQAKRMNDLERENVRLKRLVADADVKTYRPSESNFAFCSLSSRL